MKWTHIMNEQPVHGEKIIQIDAPYEGHYSMGMREYYQKCSFKELIDYYQKNDLENPNFWWISAKDFPFPDQPDRLNPETLKGSDSQNTTNK